MNNDWKYIIDTENKYMINDVGMVKSLYFNKEIILKPRTMKGGYLEVGLTVNKKRVSSLIHRLVADHFVNGRTKIKNEVNHIDGNKLNNKPENLEWLSHRENMQHAHKTLLIKGRKGEKHNLNKLSEKTVIEIKKLISHGLRNCEICEGLNVKPWNVHDIKYKKSWGWLEINQ